MPTCTRYDINLVCWADIPFFGELFRGFPFYFLFLASSRCGVGDPCGMELYDVRARAAPCRPAHGIVLFLFAGLPFPLVWGFSVVCS